MNKKLYAKIMESLTSVLPVTLIVLILCITITPMPTETFLLFMCGAAMLIFGMGLFTLGADMAMMPIGEHLGDQMTKTKKLGIIVIACFIIGVLITIAEPDLQVLAGQTPAVPDMVLILAVALGVGVFLAVSFLRILFNWNLATILIIAYTGLFILSIFVPAEFLPVAFDSGGVTTGPITVPFILALGIGLTKIRNDDNAENDSFGLVGLCSVGPILAVLILGKVYSSSTSSYTPIEIPVIQNTRELFVEFARALPEFGKEVFIALLPIFVFFLIFQVLFLKLRKKYMIKILIGIVYTFLGLTFFLTGVNVGFMPAGNYLGQQIASLPYYWVIVPIGMLLGYFIVKAEPAVLVLNKQVEEITGGSISQGTMMLGLSVGMAISVGLSMVRILTGLPILWLLVPGYGIALSLSFFVPKVFTAIAFDSGGVASGPMTATFLLPFAMGACDVLGGNILTDAFGIVAMVAMTPLITIQILGLIYNYKTRKVKDHQPEHEVVLDDDEIIDYEEETV